MNSDRLSRVSSGPQVSAPTGTVANSCTWPRSEPSVGHANRPLLPPVGWVPSLASQMLPSLSKVMLSGEPIGLTLSLG
jgi:hypothetical protein